MSYVSYIPKVIKALDDSQEKLLDRAAVHMKKAVRDKIKNRGTSRPGEPPARASGQLLKGVKIGRRGRDVNNSYRIVGMGPPAHHAHLLEFGTVPRTVKNYLGKKGVAVQSGRVLPRPFMRPAFEENVDAVEAILNKAWI
jgi:HK97 gp10 family phage protein